MYASFPKPIAAPGSGKVGFGTRFWETRKGETRPVAGRLHRRRRLRETFIYGKVCYLDAMQNKRLVSKTKTRPNTVNGKVPRSVIRTRTDARASI